MDLMHGPDACTLCSFMAGHEGQMGAKVTAFDFGETWLSGLENR